jgi:hypothetical protein
MKSYKPLLLLAIALFAFNCKKDDSTTGPSNTAPANIWPLQVGNAWRYSTFNYDTSGQVTFSGIDSTTWRVTRDTLLSGERWYWLAGSWVTNRSNGFCVKQDTIIALYFKYPASVGETWTIPLTSSANIQASLVSTGTNISTQGGTFACYLYRMLYLGGAPTDWYVQPGLGMVVREAFSVRPSGGTYRSYRMELISYTLH